jgi:protease-4
MNEGAQPMSLDADTIVDRRRMRRKLTFWRVLAVLVAIGAVLAVALAPTGWRERLVGTSGAYIARVTITGLIRDDLDRGESLHRLANSRARAVIVHVDSPGGTTAGAEQLYTSLRQLQAKKPMVVVVDGLAASGGYIAAMGADHIIAQGSSIVGSIGVLFQYPNVVELLKTLGVTVEEIKSSPLKAAPNPFEPTTPEARAAMESVVMDAYAWFRALVKERRNLDEAKLTQVADGRIFTGRQALELKLIDQLGQEAQALEYLAKQKNVDPKLPVRDWALKSRFSDLPFLHLAAASVLESIGLGALARTIRESATVQAIERLSLDGLLALWHPPAAN